MRLMSRITLRSAGAAVAALGAGLAQAHPDHGMSSLFAGHSHGLEQMLASTMEWIAPFLGELIVLSVVSFGAVLVWRRLRRGRSSRSL